MAKHKPIRHLGCLISPDGPGWRAVVPRVRGAGRVKKYFANNQLADARAWIAANLAAVQSKDYAPDLQPAQIAEYRAAKAILPADASLVSAAQHYAAQIAATPSGGKVVISDAISDYIAAKTSAGCRPVTLASYAHHLRRLPATEPLISLNRPSIEAALVELAPRSRNNHIRDFGAFFGWCRKRGLMLADPLAGVELSRTDEKPVGIYRPEQVRALLAKAAQDAPDLVPLLALGFFAGVRSSGILRLAEGAVDLDKGVVWVSGAADKLRRGYAVQIRPCLSSWLNHYPFKPYPVTASYFSNRLSALLKSAKIAAVPNGMRHSFGTYLLADTHDAAFVAAQMGQWGGVATLVAHYRAAVSPADAANYWSICPDPVPTPRQNRRKRA